MSTTADRERAVVGGPPPGAGDPRPRRRRRRGFNVLGALGAGGWFVLVAVPLYFLFVTSLRASSAYLAEGPLALPAELTVDNYLRVLGSDFPRYFLNNVLVAAACVAIVLVLALPAAYGIVRSRSRWVARGFSVMLLGLAVPAQAVIVPLYLMVTQLRLYDTLLAVILPTAAFALPLAVVVLTSSLRDIPNELFEAATLDGAGPARTLVSLVLPLARPGLATIGIFTALQAWNGFLFPLVLTQDASVRVLTLGLWDYQGQYGTNVPLITAAVVLSLLPLLVVYLLGRRYLLAGLTAGAGR
ncbi:carbohydrate ABC transporter permease [Pseudonocardia sp. KRD291]|uniref:carbohydrate ABC transporter permease n=1 Tax=Pseudonocardia sp. KRD291 TaxID=2792007 RepID=UPI0027E262FD|nr:carbohydrate ABC transporter permease [Pseudonocardia sp. KRD291]